MKNFFVRAFTGIVFVAVLLGAISFSPFTFLALFCLITGFVLWEFYGLLKYYENAGIQRAIGAIGGVYLFVATFLYTNNYVSGDIFLPYLIFLLYTMISELYFKESNPINNWAFTLFAQVYCAGFFSLLNFIASSPGASGQIEYHPLFILALFIFVWLNDTGAYLIGSMFGKHRLFERISPKKSWEGFIGGIIITMLGSLVFAYFYPTVAIWKWVLLAAVIVIFSTWGDLTESLLKRTLGVKDSGKVLPGHGGLLDRFDSVMMASPAAYIFIELVIRN